MLTRGFVDIISAVLLQTSTSKVVGFGLILLQYGGVCTALSVQKYLQNGFSKMINL